MDVSGIPDGIRGHEELVALFGRWPTFHDAEVLSIALMRDEGRRLTGPVCTAVVCPIGEPGAPAEEGPLVTLRFYDVYDLHLRGFNHQNPILGLEVVPFDAARGSQALAPGRLEVTFMEVAEGDFGARFTCSRVEVVSLQPLPDDWEGS